MAGDCDWLKQLKRHSRGVVFCLKAVSFRCADDDDSVFDDDDPVKSSAMYDRRPKRSEGARMFSAGNAVTVRWCRLAERSCRRLTTSENSVSFGSFGQFCVPYII